MVAVSSPVSLQRQNISITSGMSVTVRVLSRDFVPSAAVGVFDRSIKLVGFILSFQR